MEVRFIIYLGEWIKCRFDLLYPEIKILKVTKEIIQVQTMNMKLLVGGATYPWAWVKGSSNEAFGAYMSKSLAFAQDPYLKQSQNLIQLSAQEGWTNTQSRYRS